MSTASVEQRATQLAKPQALQLQPLRDYVLCEALPDPPKSTLLVTISAPNTAQRARVVAIGPECRLVKAGETVLISRHIGQTVGDQLLVQEPYIMAWV